MDVGWVLVWTKTPGVRDYLARTGFRFDYRADGVSVYRPAGRPGQVGSGPRVAAAAGRNRYPRAAPSPELAML